MKIVINTVHVRYMGKLAVRDPTVYHKIQICPLPFSDSIDRVTAVGSERVLPPEGEAGDCRPEEGQVQPTGRGTCVNLKVETQFDVNRLIIIAFVNITSSNINPFLGPHNAARRVQLVEEQQVLVGLVLRELCPDEDAQTFAG